MLFDDLTISQSSTEKKMYENFLKSCGLASIRKNFGEKCNDNRKQQNIKRQVSSGIINFYEVLKIVLKQPFYSSLARRYALSYLEAFICLLNTNLHISIGFMDILFQQSSLFFQSLDILFSLHKALSVLYYLTVFILLSLAECVQFVDFLVSLL